MKKLVSLLFLLVFILAAALDAQPSIVGVANTFSGQATFSPGSLVSVYGKNLMVGTTAPTVMVGTKAGFAVAAGSLPAQLLVQLPVDAPLGATTLTVTAGGQTSAPANLTITAYAPALDTANASGSGPGVFLDAASFTSITSANPARPGETITGYAEGLGATTPAVATGALATGLAPTVATVTVTVGGESAVVPYAGLSTSGPGLYQVNFTVPKDASNCGTNVVLTVGGVSSPLVTVPIATPGPIICAIENSATGLAKDATHGLAANSFITLYAAAAAVTANSAANIFPATSYQGVEVLFNGTPVPLYAVNNYIPGLLLINAMAPSGLGTTGTASVTITTTAGTSPAFPVALTAADPGVFRLPNPTTGLGSQGVALVVGTYSFAMPASLAAPYGLPPCTGLPATSPCGQPAAAGSNIVIYLTGGGLATANANPSGSPVPTGSVAPLDGSVVYQTVLTPTITIGGISAPVGFSGIAPGTGSEYQINTTIPTQAQAGDTVPVMITMGGNTDVVTIAVAASGTTSPECAIFPATVANAPFVPFSVVNYVSGPNSTGDQLVVGSMTLANLNVVENLPLPTVPNQRYCGTVTLANGSIVTAYVPTAAERSGNFSPFSGLLIDPMNNLPFPNGIIPVSLFGSVFAWRIPPQN